jgi:predicted DNA-binding transcriptional regulator YafY
MRRAERLFRVIQLLRRRKLVRARDLAETLEVSERTIYRDIAALMASGVPVWGEAGVGYALRAGFDLPPLMFEEQELEALILGARIVQSWTDPELAAAAADAIAKVEAVLPERLKGVFGRVSLSAPAGHRPPLTVDLALLRRALKQHQKIRFCYRREGGERTERSAWPLDLAFFGPVWLLAAWCELRQDFRSFRLDRMSNLALLEERFRPEPGKTLQDFLRRPPRVLHA